MFMFANVGPFFPRTASRNTHVDGNQGSDDETLTSAWESYVPPKAIVQTTDRSATVLGCFGYAGEPESSRGWADSRFFT